MVLRTAYGIFGSLVIAYAISVVWRGPSHQALWLDGWAVSAFEVSVSLVALAAAFFRQRDRVALAFLGAGLLSWSLGDIVLSSESMGGATPPVPSAADFFYLLFYPCAYVALVLLLRRQTRSLAPRSWLDGAIAGVGAAAVCAAFAFHTIVHSSGAGAWSVATNLAYPVGDVLLLGLVIGAAAMVPSNARRQWIFLAAGIALTAGGDTANILQLAVARDSVTALFNAAAWPAAITIISLAMWLRAGPAHLQESHRSPGFVLPGIAAMAGMAVLIVATFAVVPRVAVGLATCTLVFVGIRLMLSLDALRSITVERHRQAVTDELTGLGNRRLLFGVLDAFFSDEASHRKMAFLFIDLNHFKELNDSFGHAAGDDVLRQLGPRLQASMRPSDILVRLGGDEFAAVLVDVDEEVAENVATRLSASLAAPFVLGGVKANIGASIGIALAPSDATDRAGLLWCADVAMYRAKLGGHPFVLYDQLVDDNEDHLGLAAELRSAVEGGHFMLHYQPQVDLATSRVTAVEALVRWPHPRLGLLPPIKFLALAEETGLMKMLTAWVLDKSVRQAAAWLRQGREITVSVNVSATDLLAPTFYDEISKVLELHKLPPGALVLEITETSVISEFERCKLVIERLRDLGVDVSIDDFGAGFTSLAYLSDLAVGELKLDRSFITTLAGTGKSRNRELVRAIVGLGHALGLRVVAEGIEDGATLALITELGCDLAQGYFLGPPVPAEEIDRVFEATSRSMADTVA